jgi:hypothetical protein
VAARVQEGNGDRVPTPVLAKVTVPVGVIGDVDMSVIVARHVVGLLTLTEPGEHAIEVVVTCEAVAVVAFIPYDPELIVWLEADGVPSPKFQTSW